MPPPRRRIIEPGLHKHVEIASFLWGMRGHTVLAPYCTLATLHEVDGRLDTHLGALRSDPARALHACGAPDTWLAGTAFVGAWVAFGAGDETAAAPVLEVLEMAPDLGRHVAGALGWLAADDGAPVVRRLLDAESPDLIRTGISASVIRGDDPGDPLRRALAHANPWLRSRALRAVGELGLRELKPSLADALSDENDECRFAAAWSAALLGETRAIPVLGTLAVDGGARAEQACAVALRALSLSSACAAHGEIVREFGASRLPVLAAGMIGDPRFVSWLIEQMDSVTLAPAAGEAFSRITGADLAYDDLDGEPPEVQEPDEEPAAEAPKDADEGYLWPDVDRVAEWWAERERDFRKGHRYLLGQPITAEWLKEVLLNGRQPHRAAAAIELALAFPGRALFDVRAAAARQDRALRRDAPQRTVRRRIDSI